MPTTIQVLPQQQHRHILATADRDSLMALEALMKIKTDSSVDEKNNLQQQHGVSRRLVRVSPDTPPLAAIPPPALMIPAARTSAAPCHVLPKSSSSPVQQHMKPTTVALHPVPVQSAPYPSWLRQHPLLPVLPNPTSPPATVVPVAPRPQQQVRSTPPKKRTKAAVSTKSTATKTSTKSTSKAASIRRDKIEAALRSKPQRGKKRENLSVLERMELTRTRNREHAKTTRERKKARYQELLQCEQELNAYKKQEELLQQRREALDRFLSDRLLPRTTTTTTENVDSVQFEATRDGKKQTLTEFDAHLVSSFGEQQDSGGSLELLQFQVQDMAIHPPSGVGFAKVTLFQQQQRQVELMTAMIHFRFESNELVSMEFVVVSSNYNNTSAPSSNNKFGYQSFPSVVSLEANNGTMSTKTTTTPSTTPDEGPGMHI